MTSKEKEYFERKEAFLISNKLYSKLSKKYSGEELEYKIKQHLYKNGYR